MAAKINMTFLNKLSRSLFEETERQERFAAAFSAGEMSEKAVLWLHERPSQMPFSTLPPAAWQPDFVDRVAPDQRPGSLPLHESGAYYCLDLSSIFSASVLLTAGKAHATILDACSAPGGKGIFAWRALQPELLVCNEVIGKRAAALISNLKRCHIAPCIVSREDTRVLAETQPGAFSLVIADVPCSGQSLIVKGEDSPGCFHPATINMNSNRQKRILANLAAVTACGGHLAYMTCTYSRQENEDVVRWLFKKFPHFAAVEVPHLTAHRSHLSEFASYRLWPFEGLGAGAFVTLLRNESDKTAGSMDSTALRAVWRQ